MKFIYAAQHYNAFELASEGAASTLLRSATHAGYKHTQLTAANQSRHQRWQQAIGDRRQASDFGEQHHRQAVSSSASKQQVKDNPRDCFIVSWFCMLPQNAVASAGMRCLLTFNEPVLHYLMHVFTQTLPPLHTLAAATSGAHFKVIFLLTWSCSCKTLFFIYFFLQLISFSGAFRFYGITCRPM